MAKQNQSQSSDAKEGTESDQGNEVAIKTDATSTVETQQPAPVVQKSVSLDEHHGHGGLYEIRQGQRVLIERTGE